jgi:hypothetical protein
MAAIYYFTAKLQWKLLPALPEKLPCPADYSFYRIMDTIKSKCCLMLVTLDEKRQFVKQKVKGKTFRQYVIYYTGNNAPAHFSNNTYQISLDILKMSGLKEGTRKNARI